MPAAIGRAGGVTAGHVIVSRGAQAQQDAGIPATDPSQVSSLFAWYKADAIAGKNDGDTLAAWNDSSGNARNATAAGSPTYQTNEINGLPVVRLGGGWDHWFDVATFVLPQPNTVIAVALRENDTAFARFVYDGITTRQRLYSNLTTGNVAFFAGSSIIKSTSWGLGSWRIATAAFDGSSSEIWLDGTSVGTGDPGTNGLDGLRIGSPPGSPAPGVGQWHSDIAELIFFSGVLPRTDRVGVQKYLSAKYGITVT